MYSDKRTILPSGLLSSKPPSSYVPQPINVKIPTATKPDPTFINIDKEKEAATARYSAQMQQNSAQFAASQQAQQQQAAQQAAAGGGGKIICAEYHKLGILDDELNALDQAYGAYLMQTNKKWQQGYLRYAKHVVKHLHNKTTGSKILISCLRPFVNVWAQEMGFRMGGNYKHSWLGSFYMWGMVKIFLWLNSARVIGLRIKSSIKKIYKLSIFSKC